MPRHKRGPRDKNQSSPEHLFPSAFLSELPSQGGGLGQAGASASSEHEPFRPALRPGGGVPYRCCLGPAVHLGRHATGVISRPGCPTLAKVGGSLSSL